MMVGDEADGRDEAEADMMGGWSLSLGILLRFVFCLCNTVILPNTVRSQVISTEDTGSFVAVCSKELESSEDYYANSLSLFCPHLDLGHVSKAIPPVTTN